MELVDAKGAYTENHRDTRANTVRVSLKELRYLVQF